MHVSGVIKVKPYKYVVWLFKFTVYIHANVNQIKRNKLY